MDDAHHVGHQILATRSYSRQERADASICKFRICVGIRICQADPDSVAHCFRGFRLGQRSAALEGHMM